MKRAIYQIYAKIRLEIARGLFDNTILNKWKDWPKYLTYRSPGKKNPSGTILKFRCFSCFLGRVLFLEHLLYVYFQSYIVIKPVFAVVKNCGPN